MSRIELLVGDPAPAFPPAEFLKGTPFTAFEPGHVYVVECWATWCGPCLATIPHLTQMQKDHPDARFVGVAVWEKTVEDVRTFVAEKGDAMGYAVALDVPEPIGSKGWMSHHWLTPAYEYGIPAAFIVNREGRVAWIGHPAVMEEVLPSIMDGNFDIEAATERHAASMRKTMTREKAALQTAVQHCLKAGDRPGAIRAYDAAFADCPRLEPEAGGEKLRHLLREDGAGALSYGHHLVAAFARDRPLIKRAVAAEIVEALDEDAELPGRQALGRFVIDLVQSLEAEKAEDEHIYQACARARYLALSFLADDRPSDALRQAEAALALGRVADISEWETEDLQALLNRCANLSAAPQH